MGWFGDDSNQQQQYNDVRHSHTLCVSRLASFSLSQWYKEGVLYANVFQIRIVPTIRQQSRTLS